MRVYTLLSAPSNMTSSILLNTPGEHNATCIAWCITVAVLGVSLAMKIIYAVVMTKTALTKGMAYVPGGALGIKSLLWVTPRHREEFVLLAQSTPRPYALPLRFVPGHVEQVKEVPGSHIDVEVTGSGECAVLWGVSARSLRDQNILAQFESLKQHATFNSQLVRFESSQQLRFLMTHALDENLDPEKIPLIVYLISGGTVELTVVYNSSRESSGICANSQMLISDNESMNIVPIFSQNVDECMVCYDARSNVVILDCRHCCICYDCMQRLRDSRCIVCRHRFNKFLFLPPSGHISNPERIIV